MHVYVILYNVQVCKIIILGRFCVRLRHKLVLVIKVIIIIIIIIIIISCYLSEDGSMTKRNIRGVVACELMCTLMH